MPNPERINIKDLTLEEPEKKRGLLFEGITGEDWKNIIKTIEHPKGIGFRSWSDIAENVAAMKILFPEGIRDLEMGEDALWSALKQELEDLRRRKKWKYFFQVATNTKIIFPERTPELNLDDELWKKLEGHLRGRIMSQGSGKTMWTDIARFAMEARFLFPEKFSQLELGDDVWRGVLKNLEKHLRKELWTSYCQRAAQLRVVFPGRFHELKVKDNWQNARDMLAKLRTNESWNGFLQLASAMKLLAAEDIKITNRSVEIIMKETPDFKEEIPPIPQTRKF